MYAAVQLSGRPRHLDWTFQRASRRSQPFAKRHFDNKVDTGRVQADQSPLIADGVSLQGHCTASAVTETCASRGRREPHSKMRSSQAFNKAILLTGVPAKMTVSSQ